MYNVLAGNSSVRIGNLVLVQSGTYQEQHVRPFNMAVTDAAINQLHNATRGGMNLGVSAVQEIAGSIVAPAAQTEGLVGIKEGWTSRRFRGFVRVHEEHPMIKGTSTQRIFFIYTDQCDVSYGNLLDPNMRVYFNSETVITERLEQTPMGIQKVAKVQASNQIVTPVDMMAGANGLFSAPAAHLIRPEDIFSIGQTQAVIDRLQSTNRFNGTINRMHDHRTMVGECGAYQYSHRQDTSPVRYVSNSLSAFQHSVREADMLGSDGYGNNASDSREHLYGEAQAHAANQNIHSNSFLARLKEQANYMERGYVTWGDLCRIFPELVQQAGCAAWSMDNGQSIRKVNFAQDSMHFQGADNTSIAASLLAQAVPSLMMDCFLRHVSFAVTNGDHPGTYKLEFHGEGIKSIMEGIDMRPYLMEFERRLATDCLNNITYGNQIGFQISMASDLAGDSVINISLQGEQVVRWVAPTFTDSLFTPIVTRDGQKANKIANDMLYLVSAVVPNAPQMQSMQMLQQNQAPNGGFPQQDMSAPYMVTPYLHPQAPVATIQPVQQGAMNAISFEGL
uniref:Uncharacterized protein n=1 Tax=Pseudomonas phage RVTF4 TaxID=3236931 RepID=A0AB39CCX4_9VIRU